MIQSPRALEGLKSPTCDKAKSMLKVASQGLFPSSKEKSYFLGRDLRVGVPRSAMAPKDDKFQGSDRLGSSVSGKKQRQQERHAQASPAHLASAGASRRYQPHGMPIFDLGAEFPAT